MIRGSASCWSASSRCTSGATSFALANFSGKVRASIASLAGRESSGSMSFSTSSRSASRPTSSSAFVPPAAVTFTCIGSPVVLLIVPARAWARFAAVAVASAKTSGRTRIDGSPSETRPSSSCLMSSSASGMTVAGALMMMVFERRSGVTSSSRSSSAAASGWSARMRPASTCLSIAASVSAFADLSV